jgi:ABC-2 type transport system ATP-binding protein
LALNNLSFEVPEGVIAGFVGPNGSGKTTTMRILSTLLRPEAGTVHVFGYDPTTPDEAKSVRHGTGYMPDYFGLYRDMTAGEYLHFFAAAYRIPPDKRPRLVEDILALVSLADKGDTVISGLSRGMQQKLSLGRTLIHSPRLLLLDEPASGLDPRARIELMELLRELRSMGKTILISSHILGELHNLCDMVVIIERGHEVFTGSLEDASAGVLAGHGLLELRVAGDPDAAAALIREVDHVSEVRRSDHMLLIEHETALDKPGLVRLCVEHDVAIEEMRAGNANLEEVFMALTGSDEAKVEEASP